LPANFGRPINGLLINQLYEDSPVSKKEDAAVMRTLWLVFGGLFGLFIVMIAIARAIVY